MSKYLIYIGESQEFNVKDAIDAISKIDGIINSKSGNFIGAVFECQYSFKDNLAIVRISEDKETITVDGTDVESASFAVELQKSLHVPLWMTDMDFSFNVNIPLFSDAMNLQRAIRSQVIN